MSRLDRPNDSEQRAALAVQHGAELAVVPLDDYAANGQSQSRPLRLARADGSCPPLTPRPPATVQLRSHVQHPPIRLHGRHRLHRIVEQVRARSCS
jgi:hypothetical protein